MGIFRKKRKGDAAKGGDSVELLKITLDGESRMKVETVFDRVRFEDVKDAIAVGCCRLLDETYGKSDIRGNGTRELVSLMTAAFIGSFPNEAERIDLIMKLKKNSEMFSKVLKRK